MAYDLNTGKIKWETPYGDLPQAGPGDKLRGNVYPKSGFVITAGGLVMFASNDAKLYVLDKDTGKVLTTKDLPNGSLGVPAVYESNGRQYLLITVCGGIRIRPALIFRRAAPRLPRSPRATWPSPYRKARSKSCLERKGRMSPTGDMRRQTPSSLVLTASNRLRNFGLVNAESVTLGGFTEASAPDAASKNRNAS